MFVMMLTMMMLLLRRRAIRVLLCMLLTSFTHDFLVAIWIVVGVATVCVRCRQCTCWSGLWVCGRAIRIHIAGWGSVNVGGIAWAAARGILADAAIIVTTATATSTRSGIIIVAVGAGVVKVVVGDIGWWMFYANIIRGQGVLVQSRPCVLANRYLLLMAMVRIGGISR